MSEFLLRMILITAAAGLVTGCRCTAGRETTAAVSSSTSSPEASRAALVKRGRGVYAANCIACHNSNPKLAGTVGPELHGSSIELLRARLVEGAYPPGYKPKRTSGAMPVFPHLAPDLEALHAFLNEP